MPPRKKKVVDAELPQSPPPLPTKKGVSQTSYLAVIGILLALFAGSVVFLLSSPKDDGQTPPANAPVNININTPVVNTPVNEPPPVVIDESGSVELVNMMSADGISIDDQKIVWRSEGKADQVLVESVNVLLPGLVANNSAIYLFATPTNATRVYYAMSCRGPCDAGLHTLISFDPKTRSFIPLLNAPDIQLRPDHLSSNKQRLSYVAGIDEDGEARELWIYDLVKDTRAKLITLPETESLTQALLEFDGSPATNITWKDPTALSYKVYRAGGRIPGTENPRREIATRTANIQP